MQIRIAKKQDASKIRSIYEPYVLNTAVSFEYVVPSIEEFEERIEHTLYNYPYLVAIEDNKIVGYVYAGPFHTREAYKHAVELSIYIDSKYKKKNIGKELYEKIQEILLKQNVYSVHACIAIPDGKDEYVTNDSELFHEKMGFKTVGKHEHCGYKFGKWYSIIWMDKNLIEKPILPDEFIPFSKLEL